MVFCCAINCSNRSKPGSRISHGITFHRFPKDEQLKKRWVANLRRENFTPTDFSRICSQHFEQQLIDRTGQTTRLRPNAEPTLFDLPSHLQKRLHRRPAPKNRTQRAAVDSTGASAVSQPPGPSKSADDDHTYYTSESPRKMKRKIDTLYSENEQLRKKIKGVQTKQCKLKKKVESLKVVVEMLKDKHFVSAQCTDLLDSVFSGVPNDLMKRIISKKGKTGAGEYCPELRSFAMTLNFYSAKAYRFVRKTFDLALPHPAVIRRWYSSISGEPGFTEEVFRALKAKALAAARDGQHIVCGLLMDEMAIRKHVEWDGKKFRGFVDLGTDVDDDSISPASDALVLMVVGLNGAWKVPCGYFLVDGLTGDEKANLIRTCIQKLADIGIKIKSLTCDGPSAHFQMLKSLGAEIGKDTLIPTFFHPCDCSWKICIFLDACHMLKLVRNTLADQGHLHTADGKVIEWRYIQALHSLQDKEGLRLGNKLKSAHINWHKQKMKVSLASQTLSSSVADALLFCKDHLNLSEFQGCEATVEFIRIFDHLFDVLNSRNPLAKGFKSPLRCSNFGYVDSFLCKAENYITSLRCPKGTEILLSKRKTGFLGFLLCIKSVRVMVLDLLFSPSPPMTYLLTYRMSQDHIELFFGAVRSAGGCNNNPTSIQFMSTYRKLLMRHKIEGGRGNCTALDDTQILDTVEDFTGSAHLERRYCNPECDKGAWEDNIPVHLLDVEPLSEFKESAISYIAGYVVHMVCKKIDCPDCIDALFESEEDKNSCKSSFVHFKNRGGLVLPSHSVVTVCFETEKCIQRELKMTKGGLPKPSYLAHTINATVLRQTTQKHLFSSLTSHMFDTTPTANHIFQLIKTCTECYVKIRMHHLGKMYTEKITGQKIRKQFSKIILFKHQ